VKKPHIRDYFSKQFIVFIFFSCLSTAVNLTSRFLFSYILSYALAIVAAYIVGASVAFIFNRKITFKGGSGEVSKQIRGFIIVNIIGLLQTLAVSLVLRYYILPAIGFSFYLNEVAHFIGSGTTVFTSFLGYKYFSFRK